MPVVGPTVFAGGLPLGFEADRLKSIPIDARMPANDTPALGPFLVELVLLRVDDRPGGLPRRVDLCADDVPRLVFAYTRELFFEFCLYFVVLAVSVIYLAL